MFGFIKYWTKIGLIVFCIGAIVFGIGYKVADTSKVINNITTPSPAPTLAIHARPAALCRPHPVQARSHAPETRSHDIPGTS